MTLNVDNTGAVTLGTNPTFHSRIKHMAIRYHSMRDLIKMGQILLQQTPSADMLADGLTKPLAKNKLFGWITRLDLTKQETEAV